MPPKPSQPRLTHFLCIPLVTSTSRPQLQAALNTFRQDVTRQPTEEYPDRIYIPEKAIRPLGTLHLTIGVMSLVEEEKVEGVLKFLKGLDLRELLAGGVEKEDVGSVRGGKEQENQGEEKDKPLSLTLRGLTSMHLPFQTSILYSSPFDPSSRLLTFCQRLKDAFTAAGFMVAENRSLLLHATIVNTIYVPGVRGKGGNGKGEGHGKKKAKLTLDAREILERYGEFEWMRDIRIEKVAICRMGAKKGEDGEEVYQVEGEVDMP